MESLKSPRALWKAYLGLDPRIPVAMVLVLYVGLGLTVLGIHRTFSQVATISGVAMALDVALCWLFNRRIVFPLSIFITSMSLSFLLTHVDNNYLLLLPAILAVASKHLLLYRGRHFFNPAGVAVALSILTTGGAITAAPASQWNSLTTMPLLVILLGLIVVVPKVGRNWLMASYVFFFVIFGLIRTRIDTGAIAGEVLVWGTVSSSSFLIFLFFMITDPATSPDSHKEQVFVGFAIALVDFFLHLRHNYYTFFLSLFFFASARFVFMHVKTAVEDGLLNYGRRKFVLSGYYRRPIILGALAVMAVALNRSQVRASDGGILATWFFERVPGEQSGLNDKTNGNVDKLLDPKIKNLAKFLLGSGDAVAVADVDQDGIQDIFLTNMLKASDERCALYRGLGGYKFERVEIGALRKICDRPEVNGSITHAMFTDFDNSGVQSLFLSNMGGHPYLLKNLTKDKGRIEFADISESVGLAGIYTNSIGSSMGDFNKDGLIDVVIANYYRRFLPGYSSPRALNFFHVPDPESPSDKRPFEFMPNELFGESDNGDAKLLLLQTPDHRFVLQDSEKWGIGETHWSFLVGVADLNQDGWPDIYGVRDFGPDDVYLNVDGQRFENLSKKTGVFRRRLTNNGMTAAIADYDRDQRFSVYVTNVHHAFEADGAGFWTFTPGNERFLPKVEDRAAEKGATNPDRWGWGVAATDFSNQGWVSLAVVNGFFENVWDGDDKPCTDYFYFMEKIARSPVSYIRYSNYWPDTAGACLFPGESPRLYLNRGPQARPQFRDISAEVGLIESISSSGVASVDFENNGRRGLLITHQRAEPSLYKNVARPGDKNEWIGFELESMDPRCNREAIGSKVTLTVAKLEEPGFTIMQEKQMVSGLSAQSDKRLHFGLGVGSASVTATVDWCYGLRQQKFENLKPNQYHRLILE